MPEAASNHTHRQDEPTELGLSLPTLGSVQDPGPWEGAAHILGEPPSMNPV